METFWTAIRSAPVVHLATHAVAVGGLQSAGKSYVLIARGNAGAVAVSADEIMADSTALSAELVVLSACNSASGYASKNEGTVGLQRAFLARGAQSMIISQWEVSDVATTLLMTEFYKAWLDPRLRLSKAAALRRAQLEVRKRPAFQSRFYWAAFQVVGSDEH
jgi:CHAT domain-containing protein